MTPIHKSPVVGSFPDAAPSKSATPVSEHERSNPGTPRAASVEASQARLVAHLPLTKAAASPSQPSAPIPSSHGTLPNSSLGKTQTVFIHKLYDMLEDQLLSHLIWWSPTNDSFCLYPGEEFSNVLAQYFKHTNIASFIRQLNMYGFHKVNDSFQNDEKPQSPSASGQSSTRWEFRHSANQFRKGDVQSLSLIKRKSSKVINSHKEIVSLKSLPPTSNMGDEKPPQYPEQAQQLYHRSVYQQLWDQMTDTGSTHSALPELSTPTPLNAHPPVVAYHTYPVYPHLVATSNVPNSPGLPPYPDHGVASPPYIGQPQLQPHLRQPSVQTPAIPVDQSINLKLIEMNNSIANLKAGYLELLSRYEHLSVLYLRGQSELYQLTEIVEKLLSRNTPETESKREPDQIDRSKTRTPIDRIITPNQDSSTSPMSVKPSGKNTELDLFKQQLLLKMSQPITADSLGQKSHQHNYHLDDVSLTLSKGASSNYNIVPQHYPLNPNYSLYTNSDAAFRHFKMSNEEIQQRQKGPHPSRNVSVFMDPLQPVPSRTPVANPTSLGPDGKEKRPSDSAVHPYVQQYQPLNMHQPPVHAIYQYIRQDIRQEPLQQRTLSLPVIEKTLPPNLMTQQRHSSTTTLRQPQPQTERHNLIARAQSPRSHIPGQQRPTTPQGSLGQPPHGALQHSQHPQHGHIQHVQHVQPGPQIPPIQRPERMQLPHAPPIKVELVPGRVQTPPRDLKLPLRNQLPSVSELDKSIKSSGSSGRVYDILLDSGEDRNKKRKVET
ncbi:CIC11C00000005268 [Sungouiella intermedia]|uniref:Heat shock transcription factor n=1 Tax=Sungouiella intermedia TaxID=45354 RepID=A0A1L0BGG9_9ASCO|nr:CIC11C00000005268 [[Candida] intermedia]